MLFHDVYINSNAAPVLGVLPAENSKFLQVGAAVGSPRCGKSVHWGRLGGCNVTSLRGSYGLYNIIYIYINIYNIICIIIIIYIYRPTQNF